jgi:spermidine synthase
VQGDARLSLEKEESQNFDVLAIDAFSGDSVPIHLITREAVAVYLRHMNSKGIIAFHVTNTFLSLAPVVQKIAADHGLYSVLIHDDATNSSLRKTDWVLIARDKQILQAESMRTATSPIKSILGLSTWTDDFNNLFEVLK